MQYTPIIKNKHKFNIPSPQDSAWRATIREKIKFKKSEIFFKDLGRDVIKMKPKVFA
jgi:hypothetical protein